MKVLEAMVGLGLVVAVLYDVFQSVVVPRRATGTVRISRLLTRWTWRGWRAAGVRLGQRREGFLASYAPLSVMLLLVVWVLALIVGYGLLLNALNSQVRPGPQGFGGSMYFAATALFTIGFGDIVATGTAARMVALAAGATGLGVVALVVTFLFSLYGSFQRRELRVVVLEAGAGAPPSGVTLLETYAQIGLVGDLAQVFQDWQAWAAEVLDSHLAYPTLGYFRSSHDNDSWISSLGAVMDAATLVLTTIEDGPKGWAKLAKSVGGHCIEDLFQYFRLSESHDVGLERAEFDEARRRLAKAGYALVDADLSWERFAQMRAAYAGRVNALAGYWATPPAQWIGDRSPLRSPRGHGNAASPAMTRWPDRPTPAPAPDAEQPALKG